MFSTARLLTAIAVAAVALPAAAASSNESTETKIAQATAQLGDTVTKKTPEQVAQEKADKEKKRAEARKPATTQQEKILERTGSEQRDLGPVKKMTPEEKAADKAAKRIPPTKEEQEKARKASPGG